MSELNIKVKAQQRATSFCPVKAELDMAPEQARKMALVDAQRGTLVPCQVEPCGEGAALHWVLESAAPGQELTFRLTDDCEPARPPGVKLEQVDDHIAVKVGDEVLTNYYFGQDMPRPVLYPIRGPFGAGVTRAYPMEELEVDHTDHPHHRSVWVAWGDVNGSDNWSEVEGHGTVPHTEFERTTGGGVFGCICARNEWRDAEGKKLMEDRMVYRFYNLPSSMRFIELEVAFTASEGDVRFGDTKEGGICSVRVAYPMEVDRTGQIENSLGGVNEPETWGKRAQWCDYNGVVEEHRVGIAVFDHPSNFRHPTYWHVRNYGLMTANPFGLSHFRAPEEVDGSYTLPAGETLNFRYGLFVHAGDAAQGGVRGRYLDWIHPPTAEVVE